MCLLLQKTRLLVIEKIFVIESHKDFLEFFKHFPTKRVMKFVIEHLSKNSGRLGHLVQQETGKQFKTPLLIQVTKVNKCQSLIKRFFYFKILRILII